MKIQMTASSARHLMHVNQRCHFTISTARIRRSDNCLIGCTNRLFRHMTKHYYVRHTSTTPLHNACVYRFIREQGGWNDWAYGILETATLTTMEQRKLKRRYIETLKATLNTYLPTRTDRGSSTRDGKLATPSNSKVSKRMSYPCNFILASMYPMNLISYIKL